MSECSFHSKIVGVSKPNDDGSSRQEFLTRCRVGERLKLVREPTNPYGSNAIKVCRLNGEQLGYISAELSERMAPELDAHYFIDCVISNLTGGGRGETRGCNIHLTVRDPIEL